MNRNRRYSIKYLCALVATVVLFCACKATPAVDQRAGETIPVMMAGVQRHQNVEKLTQKIEGMPDADLERHIGAIAGGEGPALIKGNAARLLVDGPMAYAAMFKAIDSARSTINVEVYIFEDDEMGNKLKTALLEKQKAGVKVRVIYDSLGSLSTPAEFFQQFTDAGVEVGEFNPVDPTEGKLLDLNNRDHRKLLIVDGKIAFTGGINVSSVYSRGSAASLSQRKSKRPPSEKHGWRDTQIEVRGPAVATIQKIFFETWNSIAAEKVVYSGAGDESDPMRTEEQSSVYYPSLDPAGNKFLRVVASSPDDDKNIIYTDFLVAIRSAHRSVHVTMAYFAPGTQMMGALCDAAHRNVDVELVLPGFSDVWAIFEAGRAHYAELLECGVKIYELHDALLHAKTVVIDGVWSTVGSSNMDMRSFLHNREVNVIVLGNEFAAEMEAMFQHDVSDSRAVTAEEWGRRPLLQRMGQWFANAFSYWL